MDIATHGHSHTTTHTLSLLLYTHTTQSHKHTHTEILCTDGAVASMGLKVVTRYPAPTRVALADRETKGCVSTPHGRISVTNSLTHTHTHTHTFSLSLFMQKF